MKRHGGGIHKTTGRLRNEANREETHTGTQQGLTKVGEEQTDIDNGREHRVHSNSCSRRKRGYAENEKGRKHTHKGSNERDTDFDMQVK